MAIDPHYIPLDLAECYFVDKDSGAPLSGGIVTTYRDNQPSTLKPFYQITGSSPNYSYVELPNPLTLSSVGTFIDGSGNPVIPYYYPWLSDGKTQDLYKVVVDSSGAVNQFTRYAMPYPIGGYNPGPGPDSTNTTYTNQISNPEFSEVLFDTSSPSYTYNFNAGSNQVVTIAPNWDIVVSCAGSATVTVAQETPAGNADIPFNPGTYLNINSGGVSKLLLRQRIYGAPALWSSNDGDPSNVASTFVAYNHAGSPLDLNLYYSQSAGTSALNQLLAGTTLVPGSFDIVPGTALIPVSDSPDTYPNGYVDIFFDIPINTEWDISTVMVTPTGNNVVDAIDYEAATPYRQTDQLYHYEYPIVPVGTVIDFAGYAAPLHYLLCDGTNTYDRVQYQQLFRTITLLSTVTLASSNTYSDANAAKLTVGTYLEGTGIPANTTISAISGTTVTISNAATITGSSVIKYFPWGAGSTTSNFAVPNLQGYVVAGIGGGVLGAASSGLDGLGNKGGATAVSLSAGNLPPHTHTMASSGTGVTANTFGPSLTVTTRSDFIVTGNGPGSSAPFSIIQPTAVLYKYIRYE